MAKLRLLASLGFCLIVAHVAIVCTDPKSSSSNLLTKFFSSQRKPPRDRTNEDWKKQARVARKELSEKVKEVFGKNNVPDWFNDAKESLKNLRGISPETDCTEQLQTNLLSWQRSGKELGEFYAFINDYLELYLDVCGYEECFKRAIEILKPISQRKWDFGEHPNLFSYLRKYEGSSNIAGVLSAIKGLSELGSIPEQIDCSNEHETNLLDWLDAALFFAGWREFVADYFSLYLNECGMEKVYKNAVVDFEPILQPRSDLASSQTLYGYLKSGFWGRQRVERMLVVIRHISELESHSGDTDCVEELEAYFFGNLREIMLNQQLIKQLMDKYFPIFLDKCRFEARFKKVVANIQQAPLHRWRPTAYPTLLSCLKGDRFMKDISWIPSAIKKLSELNIQSKQTYCTDEVLVNLIDLRKESEKFKCLSIIMADNFSLYLDKCGLEESFQERNADMKQTLNNRQGSSEYSTLFSYLENKDWDRPMLIGILSTIRKLPESNSVFKETDCTKKLLVSIIEWLVTDKNYQDVILKQYFVPYLDKCGLEAQFERVSKIFEKKPNKRFDSVTYPTLYSLVSTIGFKQEWVLAWVLGTIKNIFKWESMAEIEYCTEDRINSWGHLLKTSTKFREFHMLIIDHFELYLDRCGFEKVYKKAIGSIDEQSDQYLDWVNYPTFYSYLTSEERSQYALIQLLLFFKKLYDLDGMPEHYPRTAKVNDLLISSNGKLHLLVKKYLGLK